MFSSSSHSHSSSSHTITQDGKTIFSSSSSSCNESATSLSIRVISASDLYNAQTVGKQDPFVQFTLNYEDKKTFVKTFTHQNAGRNAQWNQSFTLPLNGEPNLYVEVLDEESTVDEVIGFCAIPINQIVHAQGANLNGLFKLYTTKGANAGTLNLQLAAIGFPNSQPPNLNAQPVEAQSFLDDGHCARMKSTTKKAQGVQIGGALLGGALAVGAGFLGKKLYDDQQKEKTEAAEAERLRQEEEEAERQRKEEGAEESQEAVQHEYKRDNYVTKSSNAGDHENRSDSEKRCEDKKKKDKCKDKKYKEKKGRCRRDSQSGSGSSGSDSDSGSGSDSDGGKKSKKKGKGGKKWNPVGTYSAGDKVTYNGRTYVCLQGHTSNPTWQPGAAHSLWQAE